jgi:peptide/nickel transport system substrate-binding protein
LQEDWLFFQKNLNRKETPMKFKVFFIIILSTFFLVSSFAIENTSNLSKDIPDYGDALTIGSIADASILIPMIATDVMSHEVAGRIFLGVVKYAPDLRIIGELAEKS